MDYRFLCCRHRQWMVAKPTRAAPTWAHAMDAANSLADRGKWFQALPHIGSAFETAQLMVTNSRSCTGVWLQRHSASSQLLNKVLANIRRLEQGACVTTAPKLTIY